MASISVFTAAITGTEVTAGALLTAGTITFDLDDMSQLGLRIQNTSSTAALTVTLVAGTEFSETGQGNASVVITTEATVIVGQIESARFKTSVGTNTMSATFPAASTMTIEAYRIS